MLVEVGKKEKGNPFIKIIRFRPKIGVIAAQTKKDYEKTREVVIVSSKAGESPLEFGMKQIIKLGSDIPNNKHFQRLFM